MRIWCSARLLGGTGDVSAQAYDFKSLQFLWKRYGSQVSMRIKIGLYNVSSVEITRQAWGVDRDDIDFALVRTPQYTVDGFKSPVIPEQLLHEIVMPI